MILEGQRQYQADEAEDTLARVFPLVTTFDVAIDGGAHVGSWSVLMAGRFARVLAFEPNPVTNDILSRNVLPYPNIELRRQALLDRHCRAIMKPNKTGRRLSAWWVEPAKRGDVEAVAIDDIGLENVGLIKLDLEGAEPLALIGAKATIARCRPVLVVEIWGLSSRYGVGVDAVYRTIESMGYVEEFMANHVDHVFVPVK